MPQGGAPEGVNSAMLNSIQQASQSGAHAGAAMASGGDRIISQNLDEHLGQKIGGNVDMGLNGNVDEYFKLGQTLEDNPFNHIGDGTLIGPGNISHGGAEFVTSAMGDVDAGKFSSPNSNLNANIPKLHSGTGQAAAAA